VLAFQTILAVSYRWRIDDANTFVISLSPVRVVEEAGAATEEDGNNMDFHFVNQSGLQVLLANIRATSQHDVFTLRSVPGSLERRVNSFCDKMKSRAAFHLERFAAVMGEDKHGHVERRIFSPPAIPGIVSPRAVAAAEHAAAHDRCSDVMEVFRSDVIVRPSRAAFHAMNRAEGPRRERPVMELLPTLAERSGDALVGAGNVAVEGHRNVELEFCHSGVRRLVRFAGLVK
jgi:hypothetical protein